MEADARQGMEEADAESYAIPFLQILQTNSPQCDESDDRFVDGAKAGMFFNTATAEVHNGKKGLVVIPAHFQRRFVEWVSRDSGGGFRGSHRPDEIDLSQFERDDSGKFITKDGNYLSDTRYHFCVLVGDRGPEFAIVSMSSTQIKKSRRWMTMMGAIRIEGKKGPYCPATFSHAYRLTTVTESNQKGKWFGWDIQSDHMLTDDEHEWYAAAKQFKAQVKSGMARVEPVSPDGDDTDDDF
jgi:hypothetical protein